MGLSCNGTLVDDVPVSMQPTMSHGMPCIMASEWQLEGLDPRIDDTHQREDTPQGDNGAIRRVREILPLWQYSLKYLPEICLLRVSESSRFDKASVTRDIFEEDTCCHCGERFVVVDNRAENCIPIINKNHRRHKGCRSASERELRNLSLLVENRKSIINGRTPRPVKAEAVEACAVCSSNYLSWNISDVQWVQAVPPNLRHSTLCFSCFLRLSAPVAHWRTCLSNVVPVALCVCVVVLLSALFLRSQPPQEL